MNKLDLVLQEYIKYTANYRYIPTLSVSIKDSDYNFNYTYTNHGNKADRFKIASITKLFTVVLVFMLISKNILDIDSKIVDICPQLSGFKHLDHIKIIDLLENKSGLVVDFDRNIWNNEDNFPDKNDFLRFLKTKDCIDRDSIGIYSYSNLGFSLLGYVCEVLTEKSYSKLINEHIIEPLELKHTYIDNDISEEIISYHKHIPSKIIENLKVEKSNYFQASIGIVSTARDLVSFIEEVYINYSILPKKYIDQILKLNHKGKYIKSGLGIFIEKNDRKNIYTLSGGFIGFNSAVIFDKSGLILSYCGNNTNSFSKTYSIEIFKLYKFLKKLGLRNDDVDKVDGVYLNYWSDMCLIKKGDGLICFDFYCKDVAKNNFKYIINRTTNTYELRERYHKHYPGLKIVDDKLICDKYQYISKKD